MNLNYHNQRSNIDFGIKKSMKDALYEFPDSFKEYNSYRRKNITGNVFLFSGLALALSALIPAFIEDSNPTHSNRNHYIAYGLCGSALVSEVVALVIHSSGTVNLFNAIKIFNKNKTLEFY